MIIKANKLAVKKLTAVYGDGCPEIDAIQLMDNCKMPVEAIAELLGLEHDKCFAELLGDKILEEPQHNMLINCINSLLPIGLEFDLLPSREKTKSSAHLRVLIEIYQLRLKQK